MYLISSLRIAYIDLYQSIQLLFNLIYLFFIFLGFNFQVSCS